LQDSKGVPLLLVFFLLLILLIVAGGRRRRHGGRTRDREAKRAKSLAEHAAQVGQEKVCQVRVASTNLLHVLLVPPLGGSRRSGLGLGGAEGAQETVECCHVGSQNWKQLQLHPEGRTRKGLHVSLQEENLLQILIARLWDVSIR
jgi:hypothetical protein